MFRVLITGGAGFIGTALAESLKSLGHSVTIIDLEEKFTSLHDGFEHYVVDITEYENFTIIENKEFDYIFHLAAQTSGLVSQQKPTLDADTNVKGTLNVCNFARQCNAKKIIFTSSMAVYGNKEGIISEKDTLIPLSNYGVSKVAGELYIKMFKQFDIENTIFRLFNVYGPGQDMSNMKQGMASIFMAQSILSNEINVTGSFERYRDFVYVDDVVNALLLGLEEVTDGETYNVGSGVQTTVSEIIDAILNINEKQKESFTINNIGEHEGDTFGSVSNINKINTLGWKPLTSIDQGLKKMYVYAKEVLQ